MKNHEILYDSSAASCFVGHSFGNSIGEGSPNQQLGQMMLSLADGRPMIADRTLVNAIPGGESKIAHVVEGPVTNLKAQGVGTWGTWLEARHYMKDNNLSNIVVVFAQQSHLPRVVKQGNKLGIESILPENSVTDFDKTSDQVWTRSPYLWIPFNALGSLLLKKRGQL